MVDRPPGEPQHRLPETKFRPPLLRQDVIFRPRLLDDLRQRVIAHPLTLLSAPAGYGKTTVLAALPSLDSALPLAWLSLDEEDNDPVRFFTALIIALQHLEPGCGAMAQSLLTGRTPGGLAVRRMTGMLINEMLEALSQPFALVLDDLHRIREPSIFVALDYLLEHRPPQLRLVAATRVDPPLALARLQARGEVTELRLNALRFSEEEADAFLNERLHLRLTADELALLQTHTEGWPVGLRLLATSLDRVSSGEERRSFIHHLAQTEHNIFDFLAEEVFNRQQARVRAFLLETAILPVLRPSLCAAVTGRTDAGTMLEELYRRNLFLVQVPPLQRQLHSARHVSHLRLPRMAAEDGKVEIQYRYHDLFAEFLRQRLERERPERVPELHLRAAEAESEPARAVAHFLAAARWQEAADLIEQIGAEMFARGYLDTLSRWINALPASIRESHPRLLHYLSNCAFSKGAWGDVESLLERALQGFEAAGDDAGQGEVLADLATCAVALGDLARGEMLWSRALSYPIPEHVRVQSLLGRALSKGAWGEWAETERDFNAAMALIEQSATLDPLYLVVFPFFHPGFAILPGGLEKLERICRQAREVGDRIGPSRLMVEEMTTILHLFRGRLVEAIQSGESALALKEQLGGHPYPSLDAALFLMIAHTARGEFAAVEPLFDLLFLGLDQVGELPPDLPLYLFYAGRVRWLQGRLQETHQIYQQICALLAVSPLRETPEAHICRSWMRSLLQTAEGRYGEAERALRRPEVLEQKDRASRIHGSTRLMLARLYLQQDRRQEALVELTPVLAYYEQLGIPFPILVEGQSVVPLLRLAVEHRLHERYAADLLEVLGADEELRPVDVPDTGATLTPREVEVLGLVAVGHSNRAIAENLVISEWTVKSHLTKIYRKLDVASRIQAIVLARELGLG